MSGKRGDRRQMVCDECQNEEEYQIIKENPTRCNFVCQKHKNKIVKSLKEQGLPFQVNKLEKCSCDCYFGGTEHFATTLILNHNPSSVG